MAESLAAAAELTPWVEARHHGAGRRRRQHTKSGGNPSSNVIGKQGARRFGGEPEVCTVEASKLMMRKQRKECWLSTMCPRVKDLPGVEGNRAVKMFEKSLTGQLLRSVVRKDEGLMGCQRASKSRWSTQWSRQPGPKRSQERVQKRAKGRGGPSKPKRRWASAW